MQEWTEQQLIEKLERDGKVTVFFHTPLCGTCELAKKMLTVVEAMVPKLEVGLCNLNYMPNQANMLEIESVPCLIEFRNKETYKKIYAFHSVEYLLKELK